jgi:hypothetical protein
VGRRGETANPGSLTMRSGGLRSVRSGVKVDEGTDGPEGPGVGFSFQSAIR